MKFLFALFYEKTALYLAVEKNNIEIIKILASFPEINPNILYVLSSFFNKVLQLIILIMTMMKYSQKFTINSIFIKLKLIFFELHSKIIIFNCQVFYFIFKKQHYI